MDETEILRDVAAYYSSKIRTHGACAAGVDWRDETSQNIRFMQLLRVVSAPRDAVLDLGCGYGALLAYMRSAGYTGQYQGVDVSEDMIAAALAEHGADPCAKFVQGGQPDTQADYALASGIFNVRLNHSNTAWSTYVHETIAVLDRAGRRGFAFNCLTSYSDPERMRPDLYYANGCELFDHCKRRYSPNVALLHDYGLYEFTILVRKAL